MYVKNIKVNAQIQIITWKGFGKNQISRPKDKK
jgi:hypothetical protein